MAVADTSLTPQLTDPAVANPATPAKPKVPTQASTLPTTSGLSLAGISSDPAPLTPGQSAITSATANTSDPMAFAGTPGSAGTVPTAANPGSLTPDAGYSLANQPPVPATSGGDPYAGQSFSQLHDALAKAQQNGGIAPLGLLNAEQAAQQKVQSGSYLADQSNLPSGQVRRWDGSVSGVGEEVAPGMFVQPDGSVGTERPLPPNTLVSAPGIPTGNVATATGSSNAPGAAPVTPNGAASGAASASGLPSIQAALSGAGITAPGSGSDTTGSMLPSSTPSATVNQAASPSSGGVKLTPTDPNNSLIDQTISPDNTVDRVKLAQDSLNSTIQNVLDPAYNADLRDANRLSFGAGRGVSGMNRTSLGNVQSDYERTKAGLADSLLNNATTGSIDDLYRNLGIAQQQQGFQAGQQQTAFGQQAALAQLQDALTNSAFGRAQAQETAGYANSPTDINLLLSQIFGSQATGAGQAAASLFNQKGQAAGASGNSSGGIDWQALIDDLTKKQQADGIDTSPSAYPGVQTTPGGGY